ncbi:hypothetical protein MCEGEM3_01988 [Oxalobacteraceae bacterium]
MPLPAFLFAKLPLLLTLSASPLIMPLNTALATLTLALVVPSYTLLLAMMPDIVMDFAVILAVVVGSTVNA